MDIMDRARSMTSSDKKGLKTIVYYDEQSFEVASQIAKKERTRVSKILQALLIEFVDKYGEQDNKDN